MVRTPLLSLQWPQSSSVKHLFFPSLSHLVRKRCFVMSFKHRRQQFQPALQKPKSFSFFFRICKERDLTLKSWPKVTVFSFREAVEMLVSVNNQMVLFHLKGLKELLGRWRCLTCHFISSYMSITMYIKNIM